MFEESGKRKEEREYSAAPLGGSRQALVRHFLSALLSPLSSFLSPLSSINNKLSARLSLWVASFVALVFVAGFTLMFANTRDVVKEEAWGKASQTLNGTVQHIDNTLRKVELASDNMLTTIEQHLDNPDIMFDLSRHVLESNPDITGCSISFDPYYYKEKGRYFSAYSYNDGDTILTEQEGTDNYQYHCMDWYLIPRLLDRPYWIEPFLENATEGIIVKDIFTSYSRPIHDKAGRTVGTFSVDISLNWFVQTVHEAKPYPHSFSVMLGKGGTFLVHPDTTKLFYETVFTQPLDGGDSTLVALGEAMINGKTGYKEMTIDGEPCFVFYKPFRNTGWSVAIVCPEHDIYESYYNLRDAVIWISAVGLLCLFIFTWVIVGRSIHPLEQLARSIRLVAAKQLEHEVPDTTRPDEIGQLQRSFKKMQQSLGTYINELRHQTSMLEHRNAELEKAYEQSREDERTKTAILHSMSDQMPEPMAEIVSRSLAICDNHRQMSDEQIAAATERILTLTASVTGMLNDMIKKSEN